MDTLIQLLISYGCWGMLISAFLAGSVLPFSSEVVMLGLQATGVPAHELLIWGSIGNVAGSMLNFFIGRLGKREWIHTYLHVKEEKLLRAEHFVERYGASIGFFAFIPILGSAITVALGYMRANPVYTLTAIAIGKVLRYVILLYSYIFVQWMVQ
jgi:membrane protein YqaA with SNARE-associated domain